MRKPIAIVPLGADTQLRIHLECTRSAKVIDVRLYVSGRVAGPADPFTSTEKGFHLRADRLRQLIDALTRVEAEAGRRGLTGGGS